MLLLCAGRRFTGWRWSTTASAGLGLLLCRLLTHRSLHHRALLGALHKLQQLGVLDAWDFSGCRELLGEPLEALNDGLVLVTTRVEPWKRLLKQVDGLPYLTVRCGLLTHVCRWWRAWAC